mmetsp:Transcript_161/g.412  ORF Transcript_161/g.412 Transcript_161/m.412 type:complete len:405 (-) Transcript_161:465-1679(-)
MPRPRLSSAPSPPSSSPSTSSCALRLRLAVWSWSITVRALVRLTPLSAEGPPHTSATTVGSSSSTGSPCSPAWKLPHEASSAVLLPDISILLEYSVASFCRMGHRRSSSSERSPLAFRPKYTSPSRSSSTLIMLMWSGVQGNSSLQAELSSSSASFPDASPFAIPADTRSFASATRSRSTRSALAPLRTRERSRRASLSSPTVSPSRFFSTSVKPDWLGSRAEATLSPWDSASIPACTQATSSWRLPCGATPLERSQLDSSSSDQVEGSLRLTGTPACAIACSAPSSRSRSIALVPVVAMPSLDSSSRSSEAVMLGLMLSAEAGFVAEGGRPLRAGSTSRICCSTLCATAVVLGPVTSVASSATSCALGIGPGLDTPSAVTRSDRALTDSSDRRECSCAVVSPW